MYSILYIIKNRLHLIHNDFIYFFKGFTLLTLLFLSILMPLKAQDSAFKQPSWWFGAAVGANFNYYDGSLQQLTAEKTSPVVFNKGFGVGLFAAPLIEFHKPNTRLGFMLQAGMDNRQGKFQQQFSPCNCPRDLTVKLSYITIEPSLRFAPFKSNLYVFAGPRFAFNLTNNFTYHEGPNPEIPDQQTDPDVNGNLTQVKQNLISMQVGAGYDINLTAADKKTQFVVSPFVSFHPYFGQEPRSIETWTVSTLRAGVAFKLGRAIVLAEPKVIAIKKDTSNKNNSGVLEPKKAVAVLPATIFTVNSPNNIAENTTIRELFPLRNYVFFDVGSTQIPKRYTLIRKEDVKDFKITLNPPADYSGHAERQMKVYYHILNILGQRMVMYPNTSISLVGTSELGKTKALEMAENIKGYLVTVFAINPNRINVEGINNTPLPNPNTSDIEMRKDEKRRVTILSNSHELLTEYNSAPEFILLNNQAPAERFVTIKSSKGKDTIVSWNLKVTDNVGKVQKFGPFVGDKASISNTEILGNRAIGQYKFVVVGTTNSGKFIYMDTFVNVEIRNKMVFKDALRFSVIYEFNKSIVQSIYEKNLINDVVPKIPINGTVILVGYTDIVGEAQHNQKLSLARANDVKRIIENELYKQNRNDVKFEVHAFGENLNLAKFNNNYPEERFYNRAVTIEIIKLK